MPLTREQFQKARDAGYSVEQIAEFEKRRNVDIATNEPQSEGLKTTAEKILPTLLTGATPARGERTLMGNIFERPAAAIRATIGALGPGGETPLEAYKRGSLYPEEVPTFQEQALDKFSPNTSSVLANFIGGLPASTIGLAADIATNPADIMLMLLGRAPIKGKIKTPELGLQDVTDKYLSKAINPSLSGIKTSKDIANFKSSAAMAVDAVLDNASELKFIDEATGSVVNRLPESLDDFSNAIRQSKKNIFNSYNSMKEKAGQTGAVVDLRKMAGELIDEVSSSEIQYLAPDLLKYGEKLAAKLELKGSLTLNEAQDWIELLNNRLKSFYANPVPSEFQKVQIDAKLANSIRKQLTNIVDSEADSKYSLLRKQYGALDKIESTVAKAAFKDAQKLYKGLIDYTDIFTTSEIGSGLITGSPARTLRGGLGLALKSVYKHLNNPNRMIKTMFKQADKTKNSSVSLLLKNLLRQGKYTIPETTRALQEPISESMNME